MGGPRERWLPGPGLPGPPKGPSANRTIWLEITGRGATWSKNWVLKFWSCFCNLGRRAACGANRFSRPRLLLVCPHYHCRHRQVPRVLSRQSALGHSWSCEIQTWGSPWIALSSSLHPKRRSFPHPNPLSPWSLLAICLLQTPSGSRAACCADAAALLSRRQEDSFL